MSRIDRHLKSFVIRDLSEEAGVVLVGPRQIGKTTLARDLAEQYDGIYLDLETPIGRLRLSDPEAFFDSHQGKLVVLDEVQTFPELFTHLRGIIDNNRRAGYEAGQMLLLGSASEKLLRQSSESLAGRVSYQELCGFNVLELSATQSIDDLWLRGGYPRSFLRASDAESFRGRANLHKAVIERDIPQIAGNLKGESLQRFWRMLASMQGEMFNASRVASAFGATGPTATRYLDVFHDLMLVRRLSPWFKNSKKRLVKTPKTYVRDSGLLHYMLGLKSMFDLQGHPMFGHSWEGFVIEQISHVLGDGYEMLFYRSSGGAEIDLVLEGYGQTWAIEIKASRMPKVREGFFNACEDVQPTHKVVVHRGDDDFAYGQGIQAMSLKSIVETIKRETTI